MKIPNHLQKYDDYLKSQKYQYVNMIEDENFPIIEYKKKRERKQLEVLIVKE